MTNLLRRIRGALGMGLIWAIAWGGVGGAVMETIIDPHGQIADIWPAILGLPAFLGGVIFSLVLGFAERRRRFDELSIPRFGAWGGVAGLVVGAVPVALGAGSDELPMLLRALSIMGPLGFMGGISAAGSLALARMGGERDSIQARAGAGELPRDMK